VELGGGAEKGLADFSTIRGRNKDRTRESGGNRAYKKSSSGKISIAFCKIMLVPIYLNRLFRSETKRN